jgi:hypothetical protein
MEMMATSTVQMELGSDNESAEWNSAGTLKTHIVAGVKRN